MKERSEGIRRFFFVLSVGFVLSWVIFVFITFRQFSKISGWIIVIIGIPITWLIPQVIFRVSYWVIDGFRKDRKT